MLLAFTGSRFDIDRRSPIMLYDDDLWIRRKLLHSSRKAVIVEKCRKDISNCECDIFPAALFCDIACKFSGLLALELTYGQRVGAKDDATVLFFCDNIRFAEPGNYARKWRYGVGVPYIGCTKREPNFTLQCCLASDFLMYGGAGGNIERCCYRRLISCSGECKFSTTIESLNRLGQYSPSWRYIVLLRPKVYELDDIEKALFATFEGRPRLRYFQAVL
ncbi:hypothetical protein EDC04DRAFT_867749 [Pisolithus marmoratus]|nr:hypothetical protein EDC04DRAFT_867749 [Pisolithus marmoratus]